MILLSEIMNIADLRAEIAAGNVTARAHPDDENLRVLCYSRNVLYGGQWADVVRQCRGLIVYGAIGDEENWQLIERPWKKFFTLHQMGTNWSLGDDEDGTGELALGNVDLNAPAAVTDKLDGSMLVLYPHPQTGEPAFATKGSFTSAQALHFTNLVRGWPLHWLTLRTLLALDDYTFLFEGVGPSNRIVLNYPDDAVVLLGAVHKRSGVYFGPELVAGDWEAHDLPVAETLPANSIMKATELANREGKEGVVTRVIGQGTLVKVKQEDYLAMHRAMFSYGVSAVLGIFRGANLTWSDIAAIAEAGSVSLFLGSGDAIGNVGIAEVIAERIEFLNSVVVPQAVCAVNAANYIAELPHQLFLLPKPDIKRTFALQIDHHQKVSESAPAYLFAALDGRIALEGCIGPPEKLTEVFINTSVKTLERAFNTQQLGGASIMFSQVLTAWGDESGSDRVRDPETYIFGAVIATEYIAVETRDQMRRLLLPGQRKLHWRVESEKRRDQIIDTIVACRLNGIVIARVGTDEERNERRRRLCFIPFSTGLVGRGVEHLILESRGKVEDARDDEMANALRISKVLPNSFRLTHAPGPSDPMLWVADAICGAYAAARVGDVRRMRFIERNIPGEQVSTPMYDQEQKYQELRNLPLHGIEW